MSSTGATDKVQRCTRFARLLLELPWWTPPNGYKLLRLFCSSHLRGKSTMCSMVCNHHHPVVVFIWQDHAWLFIDRVHRRPQHNFRRWFIAGGRIACFGGIQSYPVHRRWCSWGRSPGMSPKHFPDICSVAHERSLSSARLRNFRQIAARTDFWIPGQRQAFSLIT